MKTSQRNYRLPDDLIARFQAEAKQRGITETALVIERLSQPWGSRPPTPEDAKRWEKELTEPVETKADTLARLRSMITEPAVPEPDPPATNPLLEYCGVKADGTTAAGKCGCLITDQSRWIRRDGKDGRRGDRGGYPLCADCEG